MDDTKRWKRGEVGPDGRIFKFYAKENGREYDYWFNNHDEFEQWKAHQRRLEARRYESDEYRQKKLDQKKTPKAVERRRRVSKEDGFKAARREYRKRPHVRESQAAYARKRRVKDPLANIAMRLRSRTAYAIRRIGANKSCSTKELLGADWIVIKEFLENQFTDGMSWENRRLWHIDHVVPLASAPDEESLYALCHYTNLQPLWAKDNQSKGCRMPEK